MIHSIKYFARLVVILFLTSTGTGNILSKDGHSHPGSSGVTAIDVYGEKDSLHLLEARSTEGDGARSELWYHFSVDGGKTWREGSRVDERLPPAFSPRRGMDPQIASSNELLIAAWTIAGTDQWGSGPMTTAISDDGGRTWRSGSNPADSGLTSGHGFIDIAADDKGVFHIVWLDHRDGSQGLRYSQSQDKGLTWSKNISLERDTCECCSNRIVTGPEGRVAVLYRGKKPRDMKIILSNNGGNVWELPFTAGNFNWQFEGCPHVGGGLALGPIDKPGGVHALVWTGAPSAPGVHYVGINTTAAKNQVTKLINSSTGSNPDLCSDSEGKLAAVWRESKNQTGALLFSTSVNQGQTWTEPKPIDSTDASATHPLIVPTSSGFRVFWTESQKSGISVWRSAQLKAD